MKRFGLSLVVLATAIALVGCNKDGGTNYVAKPVEKPKTFSLAAGQEASLFPMEKGNQWVYEVDAAVQDAQGRQGNGKQVFTFIITDVKPQADGGKLCTVVINSNDKEVDRQEYLLNSTGLYQVSVGAGDKRKAFSPPQTIIPFPVKINSTYEWSGDGPIGGGTAKSSLKGTINDPVNVTTLLDSFNALEIHQEQEWSGPNTKGTVDSTTWWVPNVGLVRLYQEIEGSQNSGLTKLVLKSYTFGNTSKEATGATSIPSAPPADPTTAPATSEGDTGATAPSGTPGSTPPSAGTGTGN
ncbi:MAG: hypothetical protein JST40_05105 [Armatimonadetes bacterium]|nr:hypothetical protein [Armatimonadota bacterium]